MYDEEHTRGWCAGSPRSSAVSTYSSCARLRSSRVKDVRAITTDQLDRTFRVNVHSLFCTVQETLEHMPDDCSIVVTGSNNGLRRNKTLIDYSASKAAAMNFTQSMAQVLSERGIRVNCVAPGPVDTAEPGHLRRRPHGGLRRTVADGPCGRAR
jgi:NAD(P)-dependent dehydrogenase (short-subunit alcohol dehydrogenase family)